MVVKGETEVVQTVLAHLPREQYQTGRPVSVETHLEEDFTVVCRVMDRWTHILCMLMRCALRMKDN